MTNISFSLFITLMLISCSEATHSNQNEIRIQYISEYSIDGSDNEWSSVPETRFYANALGEFPQPDDLQVKFKTAWSDEGILIWLKINDDHFRRDTLNPWRSDAIEIFLATHSGADEILQLTLIPDPLAPENPYLKIIDRYYAFGDLPKSTLVSFCKIQSGQIIFEGLIKNRILQKYMNENGQFNMQVYVLDSDKQHEKRPGLVQWHNLGHSYLNSFAMHKIVLTKNDTYFYEGAIRSVITDNIPEIFVFGTRSGDVIELYKNDSCIKKTVSASKNEFIPDKFIFSKKELDIENDSLSVYINKKFSGAINLFIAPRFYKDLEEKPFERQIRVHKMKDKLSFPPENGVLFIGSSSIKMWRGLKNYFPGLNVINRGFGGSTAEDALLYINEIVLPYKPSKIFYYEGDNDLARRREPEIILQQVHEFTKLVHDVLPETEIFLISPKPSPARFHLWNTYSELHYALNELANTDPRLHFINISERMFDNEGKLREDIFKDDGLHLNRKGYELWRETISKYIYAL